MHLHVCVNLAKLLAAVSLVTLTVVAGCAGTTEDSGSSDDSAATSSATLSDAQLAAAIAAEPKDLSQSAAKHLIDETISPVLTTARLKMLNDFVPTIDPNSDTSWYLAGSMEGIVWATPRDLTSAPAGFGGQHFKTAVDVESGTAGPTRLTISGIAKADYTIDFTIAGYALTGVKIPKGSDEAATAKIIGAALDTANQAIMDTIGTDATFAPIGGDHSESPSGVDDLEITVTKGVVSILVAQNG